MNSKVYFFFQPFLFHFYSVTEKKAFSHWNISQVLNPHSDLNFDCEDFQTNWIDEIKNKEACTQA